MTAKTSHPPHSTKSPTSSKPTHSPHTPLPLSEWETPCLNCGRFGTIPGQMITDPFNNTFCSPECGWSHLLRPLESQHHRHKAVAAQQAVANGARATGNAARRRPSSRTISPQKEKLLREQKERLRAERRRREEQKRSQEEQLRSKMAGRTKTSAERAAEECAYSGNAMVDFMMRWGIEIE